MTRFWIQRRTAILTALVVAFAIGLIDSRVAELPIAIAYGGRCSPHLRKISCSVRESGQVRSATARESRKLAAASVSIHDNPSWTIYLTRSGPVGLTVDGYSCM